MNFVWQDGMNVVAAMMALIFLPMILFVIYSKIEDPMRAAWHGLRKRFAR